MRRSAEAWECEYEDCHHLWLASSAVAPRQCARCKRLNWHRSPGAAPSAAEFVYAETATAPMVDLGETFARARAGR